jgi:Flp pilus assembly protein TadB
MIEGLPEHQAIMLASFAMGLAVMLVAWTLLAMLLRDRRESAKTWEFEEHRWVQLRADSRTVRWFEPLVVELERALPSMKDKQRDQLSRQLSAAGESSAWEQPELFLAATIFEGLLSGVAAGLLATQLASGRTAVIAAVFCAVGYIYLRLKQLRDRADRRVRVIKARLPYAMDLMAFMMEAGAGFYEALATVVEENGDHVLGEEFGHVMHEIQLGRARSTALTHLGKRYHDVDIDELVFAINKGEETGTPLSEILRGQADQIRLKRSQWMERAVGEAQVWIVFPGMLIMLACLLIVMAPFILPALY